MNLISLDELKKRMDARLRVGRTRNSVTEYHWGYQDVLHIADEMVEESRNMNLTKMDVENSDRKELAREVERLQHWYETHHRYMDILEQEMERLREENESLKKATTV